jgi:hypothetical protein
MNTTETPSTGLDIETVANAIIDDAANALNEQLYHVASRYAAERGDDTVRSRDVLRTADALQSLAEGGNSPESELIRTIVETIRTSQRHRDRPSNRLF